MKRYILLAATALTLAACTNDEMTTATDGKVALKVNASIGTVDTRAVGTQWTTGDQIGISTEEGTGTYYKNVCYVWDGSSFTTSPNNAIFFETPETVTFHAYYPYKGSADYTGVSTAADNQTTANQPKIDFLYASGATASKDKPTVNFTGDHAFTHRMSQITLTFIEGGGMDLDGSWSYTLGGLKLQGTFSPQTGIATADDVAAALVLAACSQDEPTGDSLPGGKYPLELTAANLHEAVATPAVTGTRSTVDGNWEDALSVAVQVGGENGPVKEYKVTSTSGNGAKLTCPTLTEDDTQFWWTSSTESKTVRAWYPYSETVPKAWPVSLTQTEETLKKEDFMMTDGQVAVSLNNPQIAFSHLLAKVEINLMQSEYLQNASEVNVSLPGMYETGTFRDLSSSRPSIVNNNVEMADKEIIPYRLPSANDDCYASFQALVIPDEVPGNKVINVVVDGVTYKSSIWAAYNPRYRYTYNITVQEKV